MIDTLLLLTFYIMLFGYLASVLHALSQKQFRQLLFLILIPFYVFYYILKLPETPFKKVSAIACIGSFWIFFFAGILKIVFTPPV